MNHPSEPFLPTTSTSVTTATTTATTTTATSTPATDTPATDTLINQSREEETTRHDNDNDNDKPQTKHDHPTRTLTSDATSLTDLPSTFDSLTDLSNFHSIKPTINPGTAALGGFSFKKWWAYAGPGWLMAIAYLDPGNLESSLQSGAVANFSLISVLFWTTMAGVCIQGLASRLGVVSGRDLARTCRERFPKRVNIVLWFITEIAIIGSDIQEIAGTAIALQVLFKLPLIAGVILTSLDTFLFMFLQNYGIRKLEALFAIFIATMSVCFWTEMFLSKPDPTAVLLGWVVPSVPANATVQAVGMVGAVLMAHNFYLHSALVNSRFINRAKKSSVREANFYFTIDSAVSLFISFLINLALIVVFAVNYYPAVDSIPGLAEAGEVLQKALGGASRWLWGIGLLASGQASTMTGTLAGQIVMEGFLDLKLKPWQRLAITRTIALVPSMTVVLVAGGNLDSMSQYLNVLQSLVLPFALIPLLKFTSSKAIMGDFRNPLVVKALCGVISLAVISANVFLVAEATADLSPDASSTWLPVIIVAGVIYLALAVAIAFFVKVPERSLLSDDGVGVGVSADGNDERSTTAFTTP